MGYYAISDACLCIHEFSFFVCHRLVYIDKNTQRFVYMPIKLFYISPTMCLVPHSKSQKTLSYYCIYWCITLTFSPCKSVANSVSVLYADTAIWAASERTGRWRDERCQITYSEDLLFTQRSHLLGRHWTNALSIIEAGPGGGTLN